MLLLIILAALTVYGLVSWFFPIAPFIGFTGGTVLGIVLVIVILKKLARWAITSALAWGIIASMFGVWLTTAMVRREMQHDGKTPSISQADNKDVIELLKNQGFTATLAREAAAYVLEQLPEGSLEDKVRTALKYLGNGGQKHDRQSGQ